MQVSEENGVNFLGRLSACAFRHRTSYAILKTRYLVYYNY